MNKWENLNSKSLKISSNRKYTRLNSWLIYVSVSSFGRTSPVKYQHFILSTFQFYDLGNFHLCKKVGDCSSHLQGLPSPWDPAPTVNEMVQNQKYKITAVKTLTNIYDGVNQFMQEMPGNKSQSIWGQKDSIGGVCHSHK